MKIINNKKILFLISCVWLTITLAVFLLVLHNVKFPYWDFSNIFSLVVMFILPVISLIFSLVDKYNKPFINIVFFLIFIVFFVYIAIATFGFTVYQTPFYPISMSQTKDASNYLELDKLGEIQADEFIKKVFPQEIPTNATNVDYDYECEPFKFSWRVYASWSLPENEYVAEQNRISNMTSKKIENGGKVYYDLSNDERYCHVAFDDKECSIEYVDILGYYQDYRMISGVGNWE